MAVCCCSLAGTAACNHCSQNPFATEVWTNITVTTDHIEAKPFGNGIDVCPVCGNPSTIGKPQTNYDRIVSKTPEELAKLFLAHDEQLYRHCPSDKRAEDCYADWGKAFDACEKCWLDWLKAPVEEVEA